MAVATRRFGGTIPCGADPMLDQPAALPDGNCLFFSHGRAALRWLVASRGPFEGFELANLAPCRPRHD